MIIPKLTVQKLLFCWQIVLSDTLPDSLPFVDINQENLVAKVSTKVSFSVIGFFLGLINFN